MYGSNEGFAAIIAIVVLAYLFWVAVVLVGYVLKGAALSRMVKNAGIPNAALAWVPFASTWLLGVLCDRSQQAVTGRRWRFDILLPAAEILATGCGSLLAGPGGFFAECYLYAGFSYSTLRDALKVFCGFLYLAVLAVALWHLYQDYFPERWLPYTIFSVVLGRLGRGVVLMTLRNKTPRSATPGYQSPPPVQPPWQGGSGTNGWNRPPDQSGPRTTGWDPPPYQNGPGTGGWNQQPYQSGPGTTGWGQPPYQNGPRTTGWNQQPYQSGPGTTGWRSQGPETGGWNQPPAPQEPPRRDIPRDENGPGNGPDL